MYQSKKTRIDHWLKENSIVRFFSVSNPRQLAIWTTISIIFVLAGYVWFISYGFWTTWRNTTDYYDQLATAFTHGSLSIEKNVEPTLLSLTNPYDPKEREGIGYPLDFSLYDGKYYLYFGPAPALLLAIFKFFGVGRVGDHLLAFIFVSGICIFQALLIIEIRKQFFPHIPNWIIPICIIFSGLISPLPWILTEARVYEVASTSGQLFLIAGFYFNLCALKQDSSLPGRFLIGSTLWAFAVGSRLTQAPAIAFLIIMIMLLIINSYLKSRSASNAVYSIVSLGLPLVLGVASIGWYNWARFSSLFETGYSYQLTTTDIKGYSDVLFSSVYVLPNLYEYFAAPPRVMATFPFLMPVRGRGNLLFPFLDLPKIYYTRATTGIIYSTPFVLFAGVSTLAIFFKKMGLKNPISMAPDTNLLKWLSASLLGLFLCELAPFASFFWVATRYSIDFSPSLVILSIVGFWLGYSFIFHLPFARKLYTIGGAALMILSVVISSLLVFAIRADIYRVWHPTLWNQLSSLLSIFSK